MSGCVERGRFAIAAGHPCLPGHFPGDPLVPGVVLLDHVLALVLPAGAVAAGLPMVKFLRPVRPGEAVEVAAAPAKDGRIAFTARHGGETVLRGTVAIA